MESSNSRFRHLNGHVGQLGNLGNGPRGSDDIVVTAGIGFRSPTIGHPVPDITGSFVTTVINGHDRPGDATTTIVRPDQIDGSSVVIDYTPRPGDAIIGHVDFTEPRQAISKSFHLMEQQHPSNNHDKTFPLPNPLREFQILVKNVFANGKTYNFMVRATDTVGQLKQQIYEMINIPAEQQYLIFKAKKLAPNETLGFYGIKEGSEIMLEVRLRGG